MTESQLLHLLGYIGVVRASLRMQNWDIRLHRAPHDKEDTWAYTWTDDNHDILSIEICSELFTAGPWVIRNSIVHELIHAQHRDLVLKAALQVHQMERFVSWATRQIEPSVPLYIPQTSGSRPAEYAIAEGCSLHG